MMRASGADLPSMLAEGTLKSVMLTLHVHSCPPTVKLTDVLAFGVLKASKSDH